MSLLPPSLGGTLLLYLTHLLSGPVTITPELLVVPVLTWPMTPVP